MPSPHDVCITGYGLLSALPEDADQLWHALNHFNESYPGVNHTDFSPYSYHPLINYAVEEQIVKHSDRRVMGKVMQSAVYTAGVALDRAQLKNQADLLKDTQIIVALRGGERDEVADEAIIAACNAANDYGAVLNEGLMSQLRPTLFLSQLPNLLAANIALLYGITGSSLTLMGDQMAGAQAIKLASSRIQQGQAQRVLVGGVSINETAEIMLAFAKAQKLLTTPFVDIWQRMQSGMCLGSASGFLLLESWQAAKARNAPILGILSQCLVSRDMEGNWQKSLAQQPNDSLGILSMTSGTRTMLEKDLWNRLQENYPSSYVRGVASAIGTVLEAAMPVGLILALHCLQRKKSFAPLDSAGFEKSADVDKALTKMWVHCLGETYGHALTCVEAV